MNDPFLKTRYLLSETAQDRLPATEAEITFVGRSNVGKSSLVCALTRNRKLAIVSKTPGRTRAINVFEVKRGRWIVDLPGYGFAVGPKKERDYWPAMIGRFLTHRPDLARVYVLIDAERGPGEIDFAVIDWLTKNAKPFRVVMTKVDRLNRSRQAVERPKIAAALGMDPNNLLWVSAKEGFGMQALRADAQAALGL